MLQRLLVLHPGTAAHLRAEVDVPSLPAPAVGNEWQLPAVLMVRDNNGVVISTHRISITAQAGTPGPLAVDIELPEGEATSAALLLAERPGTWELSVCTPQQGCPDCPDAGTVIDYGQARSSYSPSASRKVPVGCSDCKDEWHVPAWSSTNSYAPGVIVSYNGRRYVSACNIAPGGAPPGSPNP